jgi:hypothetical protein
MKRFGGTGRRTDGILANLLGHRDHWVVAVLLLDLGEDCVEDPTYRAGLDARSPCDCSRAVLGPRTLSVVSYLVG